jgi:hypothetical protein
MAMIILPTNNVLNEFHRLACQIDVLDYDLDEWVSIVLDALLQHHWFPASFEEQVKLERQHCTYPDPQFEQFNQILWLLYERVFHAIAGSGLYLHGALQYPYFCTYRGDIIVSDEEISDEFQRAPGVN